MIQPVSDRLAMIRGMSPELKAGRFAYETLAEGAPLPEDAVASMAEAEGLSVIRLARAGDVLVFRQITLNIVSALEGVGLTAAVATALAEAGIPANVVAGHHHDHVFVPEDQAETALAVLRKASETAM